MNSSYSGISVQEWSCQMTWWLFVYWESAKPFLRVTVILCCYPWHVINQVSPLLSPVFSVEVVFILQIQCYCDLRHSPIDNHSSFVNLTLVNLFFEKSIYHYLSVSEWIFFGFNIDFFASYCWFLKGFFMV